MYGHRKHTEIRGLSLKTYKMKIQPVSCLKTQIQCETITQKWEKNSDMDWAQHKRWIMPKT